MSVKHEWLTYFCTVIGWVYFVAWSVSFYPQMFLNYKRKTTLGMSWDFQAYNFTGFLFYSVFNIATYVHYSREHGKKNPVELNDIVFAVHAFCTTCVTVSQILYFDRPFDNWFSTESTNANNAPLAMASTHSLQRTEQSSTVPPTDGVTVADDSALLKSVDSQTAEEPMIEGRMSTFAMVFLFICWLVAAYNLLLTFAFNDLPWAHHSYSTVAFFGFVKTAITLIKYIPQAYMNYRDKSTTGWSIINILLDFTGGSLSLLQQSLIAYNTGHSGVITGNIPKLVLAIESITFDSLFLVQHYVLYGYNDNRGHYVSKGQRKRLLDPTSTLPTYAVFDAADTDANADSMSLQPSAIQTRVQNSDTSKGAKSALLITEDATGDGRYVDADFISVSPAVEGDSDKGSLSYTTQTMPLVTSTSDGLVSAIVSEVQPTINRGADSADPLFRGPSHSFDI